MSAKGAGVLGFDSRIKLLLVDIMSSSPMSDGVSDGR
jgi:hypothetical protein